MQKSVFPSEYQAAHHALANITPALSALKRLDKQSLGYDESAWAETQEFIALLDQIRAKNQSVIDRGDAQHTNRPVDLINRAARRQAEISSLIEREQKALQHKHSVRDFQVAELQKKDFTAVQIDRIAPPVSQNEIDASHAIVAGLQAKAEAIRKFLSDAPRYDVVLLQGTTIYPDHDLVTKELCRFRTGQCQAGRECRGPREGTFRRPA
jgi:flagellar biosynthesis chaperone FliJ